MMGRACVVIPIYKLELSAFEWISLCQCFSVLGKHDIYIVGPEHLTERVQSLEWIASKAAQYVSFHDTFFKNIDGYNRLMKYPGFYKSFLNYDFMLIHQLDAFVFKDELEHWCNKGYDHIGAPLFEGHEQASVSAKLVGQGNGGFCLKNIKNSYRVVTQFKKLRFIRSFDTEASNILVGVFRYLKHQVLYIYSGYPFQPIINEDLFWAEVVPHNFMGFKVPKPEEAIPFSFEINPDLLYALNHDDLPFGCHAWWRYNLGFWKDHIKAYGYQI